jgi:hypothetical protein
VGLTFRAECLALFDGRTGAAIKTASQWSAGHG